ncbi:hypothetical protein, partial [Sodalis sp.]|uniref:hypothetical protein n=1 Tax=Sodalis sp. (in: enterobacteria) TaxID=1898979 RepID=UPI003872B674
MASERTLTRLSTANGKANAALSAPAKPVPASEAREKPRAKRRLANRLKCKKIIHTVALLNKSELADRMALYYT